jgi:CRP-like cAMP-binding protein
VATTEALASFLGRLDAADAEALRTAGIERRYARGTAIFHQGDDSAFAVILLEGRVKVVLMTPQGRELIVAFAGPGDLLGELAVIEGSPRSGSVYTIESVRALIVPGAALERLLATRPSLTLAVLRGVARRLQSADAQRLEFAGHDVLGRVARAIVELCDRYGRSVEEGVEITLPLSQDELAAWTSSSREGVAKALRVLRELGWVGTARRRTLVLDLPALRRYADS